ncbi:MAG: glycoside hydrolase family 3 C-terminal domain-containing protein [Candidatus Goldbacteria bacterium]|nr:glycoside hydrolase family 3 C-terminal domain-containing protein [Candidatus Goldiibacteriota bacterium]
MVSEKYLDNNLSFEERADDLISRMTRAEKLSQLFHESPAIPRLGIKKYNWWNECLHGVARAGIATVFPQAIGLAAMFDKKQMHTIASAISDEARAKYHDALTEDGSEQYFGLTFWSPNINIFRDPRWGRGQETYGECPYLTARLGVQFVRGLQGNDKKYLKTAACAKHFAAHSGPENLRHGFNAVVSLKDLYETYLPAFEALVKEAAVESVMAAYNRLNGEACCAGKILLTDILRDKWGFKGYVVSDCEAIDDIYKFHKLADNLEQALSMAIENGCDLNCCNEICTSAKQGVIKADAQNMIKEEWVNRNLKRLLITRFKLGMFDAPNLVPYTNISADIIDCKKHRAMVLKAAQDSVVLLANNGVLPLNKKKIKTVAVIGPNADDMEVLLGNYSGTPSAPKTVLKGFAELKGVKVIYTKGCELTGTDKKDFSEAVKCAEKADAVILCLGLSPKIEGEECDTNGYERSNLGLPGVQQQLIKQIKKSGKPVIVVLLSGGAVSLSPDSADAILQAWYPGQAGGAAIADIIFGAVNPSGKLPVTVYKNAKQLPAFENYDMKGRTYRYFKGTPLYPFGHGLSYTKFKYTDLKIKRSAGKYNLSVTVKNTGRVKGAEVVQVYIAPPGAGKTAPIKQLAGFEKVELAPGQKKTVRFIISSEQMRIINEKGERETVYGDFTFWVGGTQPGYEKMNPGTQVLRKKIVVKKPISGRPLVWSVYILKCADGTLYTGITKDIKHRIKTHNSGKGAQYTKVHRPVKLVHLETGYDVGSAMRREKAIKTLTREEKIKLFHK